MDYYTIPCYVLVL